MDIGGDQAAIEQLGLFDPLDESVAVYEPDGTFVYVNPSTCARIGRVRAYDRGRIFFGISTSDLLVFAARAQVDPSPAAPRPT